MTQQEQNEFRESWEDAHAWMQAVQERLKLNDNTEGPRAALEARLRETEVTPRPMLYLTSFIIAHMVTLSDTKCLFNVDGRSL